MATNFYLGTDYVGDLTNIEFDGVDGDNTVVVTWELKDKCGHTFADGTGSFVSTGVYKVIIQSSEFSTQIPMTVTGYIQGRLIVLLVKDTVDVTFGDEIHFRYPPLVQS